MTSPLALLGGSPVRTRPFTGWPVPTGQELDELRHVLASPPWGGVRPGSPNEQLESELAAYLGTAHTLTVANGTLALMIALRAVGVGAGDEVVVPAMTYIATATAASLIGAIPVFADVDAANTLSPQHLAEAITDKTRAVIAVHLHGHPADMDAIAQATAARSIPVIEDGAQALGASWSGRPVGTLGAIGAFSFANNKNITAGEGGALATNDPALARRIAELRDHGRPPGVTDHHPSLGFNARLSDFQAAILRPQLRRLDTHLDTKAVAAAYLTTQLSGHADLLSPIPATADPRMTRHGLFAYSMAFNDDNARGLSAQTFRLALRAEGIPVATRRIRACTDEPIYSDNAHGTGAPCRVVSHHAAQASCAKLVMLGQAAGSGLLLEPADQLIDVVRAIDKIADHADSLVSWKRQTTMTQQR